MATLDQLSAALVKADAAGNTDDARAFAAEIRKMRETPAAEPTMMESIKQGAGNLAAGAVRGAGSIGATLVAPYDMAKDAINGKGLSLESNRERRKGMDAGLQTMGAEPDSMLYGAGKLVGEIAGTAGAGGAVANTLSRVPGLAAAAPNMLNAIRSSGMTAGNAGMATRTAGGAIAGGVSAGLVDPSQAGMGAMVGGALPGAMRVAGQGGNALANIMRGPAQPADVAAAVTAARGAGYVIPPTQANPTLGNRILEGMSGKITTAQNASARNQVVTNRLVADTLGLPVDVPITRDALNVVRRQAGQAYDAVSGSGVITPTPAYEQALDRIVAPYRTAAQGFPNAPQSPVIDAIESLRSPSFDASAAVAQLRNVRELADTAFTQGNRGVGRSLREGAEALETAIETHLGQTGNTQALQDFRNARQLIAQTYTVEKALNATTGSIDAKKLAANLAKGRPVTGPMREAAEFAQRFPKAAQATEGMGSLPQTSPLDWAAAGSMSAVTGNPMMMAGLLARPAARSAILSPMVQNRLVQNGAPNRLTQLITPELQQFGYAATPVISSR